MTQPLTDFISAVRNADSIEQERFLIATEMAQIRAYLRKCDPAMRPRITSKLVFLYMMGENPAWGTMECITLMTNPVFSFKRVGYICCSVVLDETSEITVLVTQTLLRDLQNSDPNIQCLALSFIANLGSPEVTRAVASDCAKLLKSNNIQVIKRAGMAIVQVVRKNPDLCDQYKNSVQTLLNHTNHGVVNAGINLVLAMIEIEPKLAKAWAQFALPFTRILKSLINARPTREFSYGVFNDPYMQVKTLKVLSLLKKRSDELDGILQSIISSSESRRNTGRAILFQAVETIVAIVKKPALRGLAFSQVGRLLSMKDPNVLYSALSVFARVLYAERAIIQRGSVDSMALQRYKVQIVKCLSHQDPSIRRRALDVISALIDENNVESLIPEILVYIKLADAEFRSELVSKIYTATQRFAPNPVWNFDTVHQLLIDSGNYVSSDIISNFCDIIVKNPPIQQHAVQRLTESLLNFNENQSLMQVAAFVIGEFSHEDNGALESFANILQMPQTKPETQYYIITAVAKMATRFGLKDQAAALMNQLIKSNNLEVQQRSGEMLHILQLHGICEELLAPIAAPTEGEDERTSIEIHDSQPISQGQKVDQDDDLLMLVLGDETPAPQQPQPQPVAEDSLLSLVSPPPVTPIISQPTAPVATPAPAVQGREVARNNDFIVYGRSIQNPEKQDEFAINLQFVSTGANLTEFVVSFKTAPGWQIHTPPPSGNSLGAGKVISQTIYVKDTIRTPFSLDFLARFKYGAQPLTQAGSLKEMP